MIVHDDGCTCERCTLPLDMKKQCSTFRFLTGLQRAAEAFTPLLHRVAPPTEVRIVVTACPYAYPDTSPPIGMFSQLEGVSISELSNTIAQGIIVELASHIASYRERSTTAAGDIDDQET